MSLKAGNLEKLGGSVQLGKAQRPLERKPNFFSLFPTGNHTQGLMKTDFLFKHQEEILQEGHPWYMQTSGSTSARVARAMQEGCIDSAFKIHVFFIPRHTFQLFKIRYCPWVQGERQNVKTNSMCQWLQKTYYQFITFIIPYDKQSFLTFITGCSLKCWRQCWVLCADHFS